MGFDNHTIYKIYIEDQKKVIQIKNLQIYKDITFKATTSLLSFDKKPTFDGIQILDEQTPSDESSTSKEEKNTQKQSTKRQAKSRAERTIKPTSKSITNGRNKVLIT